MAEFADRFWTSRDGLRLHYRDYPGHGPGHGPGREDRPPILCLPGLTRNARDFENLADALAGDWRVLCPELRGRGDSDYAKDWASYNPLQYADDLEILLEEAGAARFVVIGTSLGGLLTMLLALRVPGKIAGAVLNDIGPVIEEEGLARIGSYVGQGRSFSTWMHAARAMEETQGAAFPDFVVADWLAMAKRVMALSGNGRIVFDYDMKIAEPFAAGAGANPDLWPGIDALDGRPVLFLRGALSDVLGAKTLKLMSKRLPEAEAVTLKRIGHAPTLDEPEARAAIARLLAKVA
jgi:pimeloyl-ACP methyl ester carboxylesterase